MTIESLSGSTTEDISLPVMQGEMPNSLSATSKPNWLFFSWSRSSRESKSLSAGGRGQILTVNATTEMRDKQNRLKMSHPNSRNVRCFCKCNMNLAAVWYYIGLWIFCLISRIWRPEWWLIFFCVQNKREWKMTGFCIGVAVLTAILQSQAKWTLHHFSDWEVTDFHISNLLANSCLSQTRSNMIIHLRWGTVQVQLSFEPCLGSYQLLREISAL